MNSTKLEDWIQLIGIAAIVVSLLFVGYQIKQTHEIATAAAYQQRAANGIDVISARSQLDYAVERVGNGFSATFGSYVADELSAKEIGQWWFAERLTLISFENNHYQWTAGYLSDEDWEPFSRTLEALLSNNLMLRFIIDNYGHTYRRSFTDYCLELIANTEPSTDDLE